MKVIFTGGGTAGHINPALAVAKYISEQEDCEISFCGGKGNLEETLVPHYGYEIDTFPIKGLSRGKSFAAIFQNISAVTQMLSAVQGCKRIIKKRKPDIVIGTGGYASFPMVLAATQCGVKTAIIEANAIPGIATKRLAPKVDCVMTTYAATEQMIQAKKVVETGTPVRQEIIGCRTRAKRTLFNNDLPIVLTFWGSVGALHMNEKMKGYLALVAKERQFNQVYACGKKYYDEMIKAIEKNGAIRADNIIVKDYIYDMAEVMGQSDLVVCRAGGTLNELCSAGMPSVLVPSPFAAENHQESNARVLEKAGAAVVLLEKEISSESLYNTVKDMVQLKDRLKLMGKEAEKLAHNDSLSHIYQTIKEIIG